MTWIIFLLLVLFGVGLLMGFCGLLSTDEEKEWTRKYRLSREIDRRDRWNERISSYRSSSEHRKGQ